MTTRYTIVYRRVGTKTWFPSEDFFGVPWFHTKGMAEKEVKSRIKERFNRREAGEKLSRLKFAVAEVRIQEN